MDFSIECAVEEDFDGANRCGNPHALLTLEPLAFQGPLNNSDNVIK